MVDVVVLLEVVVVLVIVVVEVVVVVVWQSSPIRTRFCPAVHEAHLAAASTVHAG
jgi:hypothetical protein